MAINLSTTRMVDDVARQFGATVIRTPFGERHVIEGTRQHRALIGGEGNGGVIFPASHEGRDALVGIALVLDVLAREKTPLTQLAGRLPQYVMTKEKLPRSTEFNPTPFAARLATALPDATISTLDGARVDTADGWAHVRPSNTEPVFRLIAEAANRDALRRLIGMVRATLGASSNA